MIDDSTSVMLVLPAGVVNGILQRLGKFPYEEVFAVMENVRAQLAAQIAAKQDGRQDGA